MGKNYRNVYYGCRQKRGDYREQYTFQTESLGHYAPEYFLRHQQTIFGKILPLETQKRIFLSALIIVNMKEKSGILGFHSFFSIFFRLFIQKKINLLKEGLRAVIGHTGMCKTFYSTFVEDDCCGK